MLSLWQCCNAIKSPGYVQIGSLLFTFLFRYLVTAAFFFVLFFAFFLLLLFLSLLRQDVARANNVVFTSKVKTFFSSPLTLFALLVYAYHKTGTPSVPCECCLSTHCLHVFLQHPGERGVPPGERSPTPHPQPTTSPTLLLPLYFSESVPIVVPSWSASKNPNVNPVVHSKKAYRAGLL